MRLFLIFLFLLSFFSCHFYDNRIIVHNKSDSILLFAISHINPVERNDIISPFFKIDSYDRRTISLMRNINYNFLEVDSISILQIDVKAEQSIRWKNGYYEYERLLKNKSYTFKNFAVDEIVLNGPIIVEFPNKGWKNGAGNLSQH